MQARLGKEFTAFYEALHILPPSSVRLNPLKGTHLFPDAERVPWCTYGRYLPMRPAFVWDPVYHAGAYYSQEASSMLFGAAIDFSKDLRVLDLCAAPGGKSSLLLSFLSPGSLLVSNELVGKRVNVLYENLAKWGFTNSVVTCNRPSDFDALAGQFDVVLVDAPCSGEGMFRKDPGAVSQWTEGLVSQCALIQKNILADAFHALAPGGTLIYSTCTFEAQENEDNIRWLYSEYGNQLIPATVPLEPQWGIWPEEIQTAGGQVQMGYYCFPHRVKGEGLFLSVVRKAGDRPAGVRIGGQRKIKPAAKNQSAAIKDYLNETGRSLTAVDKDGEIQLVNEAHLPFLELLSQNLYIRKLGTVAGLLKADTLIPGHELATSMLLSENIHAITLSLPDALHYLQRNTINVPPGTPVGWLLIKYNETVLGWAKNVGSRLNNHYPAEWRIRKELKKEDLL